MLTAKQKGVFPLEELKNLIPLFEIVGYLQKKYKNKFGLLVGPKIHPIHHDQFEDQEGWEVIVYSELNPKFRFTLFTEYTVVDNEFSLLMRTRRPRKPYLSRDFRAIPYPVRSEKAVHWLLVTRVEDDDLDFIIDLFLEWVSTVQEYDSIDFPETSILI